MFTEEEIKTAKATRAEIISQDIDTLKGIYMAGEICMWDEMREKKLTEFVPPFDREDYEKLKEEWRQFHNMDKFIITKK